MIPDLDPNNELSRQDFKAGVRSETITDATMESFGDGYGDPYVPHRRAWGTQDGKMVWAWVS